MTSPELKTARSGFHFEDGTLHCEGVALQSIAVAVGTPAYVYSSAAVGAAYGTLKGALSHMKHRVHYSVKACSNVAILALLRSLGSGVDVVSGGELQRALAAGYGADDIVFGGVGKTDDELRMAVRCDLKAVNVESAGEVTRLRAIAAAEQKRCDVQLRVNPEVLVDTPHPYTRTGMRGMKFGIPYDQVVSVAKDVLASRHLRLVGLDFHIGSQISDPAPYGAALGRMAELVHAIRGLGAPDLLYLDVGGGLGISYDGEAVLPAHEFASLLAPTIRELQLELIVEPGRYLLGDAAVLVTRVLDLKHSGGKDYVVVDAGMNDMIRPSHYNAVHRIAAVLEEGAAAVAEVDVVGPVCESGDFLGLNRQLPQLRVGDLLAVYSAGAYGFCMASNYNSRPRAAEVLVDGGRFAEIRSRETFEDLVRNENLNPVWSEAE